MEPFWKNVSGISDRKRIDDAHGHPHPAQHIVVEAGVVLAHGRLPSWHILAAGHYLAADIVDTGHVLA